MAQSTSNRSQATQQSSSSAQNKPVEKFTDGPVHVSIWENEGTKGAFRSASFEVRYKNSNNEWQSGRSYGSSALLHLETGGPRSAFAN